MRAIRRVTRATMILLMLVGYANEAITMSPIYAAPKIESGTTSNLVPHCASSAVKEAVSTTQHSYLPGTPVKMTASIRNVSSKTCTVWIGAISPSFSITNVKGVVVWNNCYVNDQRGACPIYLVGRTLTSGARYSTTVTWNQHSGTKTTHASPGMYVIAVSFSGFTIKNTIKFTLIA